MLPVMHPGQTPMCTQKEATTCPSVAKSVYICEPPFTVKGCV